MLCAAAAPISLASSLLTQNRSSASPTHPTVGAPAKKPVTPYSTTSAPATSVATTGRPHNIASITANGKPSIREGMTRTWFNDQIFSTSATWPSNTTRSASRRRCAKRSRPSRFSRCHTSVIANCASPTLVPPALRREYPGVCPVGPTCLHTRNAIRRLVPEAAKAATH
jgi:hypothetical protein